MILKKILSENRYSKYKKNIFFRFKLIIKMSIPIFRKNKKLEDILYPISYIFYIKDYGHFLRAKEFKETILNEKELSTVLVILNSNNIKFYNEIKNIFPNIIFFTNSMKINDFSKWIIFIIYYLFTSNFKSFLKSLKIYHNNIFKSLNNNLNKVQFLKDTSLISFNDQPIDISSIEYNLKKLNIINNSIVYQHGIIRLPNFYFPPKSDFFYGYGFDNELKKEFNKVNIYKSKLVEVGNLKYNNIYVPISTNINKNILLIPGPKILDIFYLIRAIKTDSYKFSIKFHPGMKFQKIIKLIIFKKVQVVNSIEFKNYSIVITEVSTVGLEALAEGVMLGILTINNYILPTYFKNKYIPKISYINEDTINLIVNNYKNNITKTNNIISKYFS